MAITQRHPFQADGQTLIRTLSGQDHEPVNDDAAAGHGEVQCQERCH